jgi:hypothetical protein
MVDGASCGSELDSLHCQSLRSGLVLPDFLLVFPLLVIRVMREDSQERHFTPPGQRMFFEKREALLPNNLPIERM